jgi:hypothetical protein
MYRDFVTRRKPGRIVDMERAAQNGNAARFDDF